MTQRGSQIIFFSSLPLSGVGGEWGGGDVLIEGRWQDLFDPLHRNDGELVASFLRNAIFAEVADRGPVDHQAGVVVLCLAMPWQMLRC